MIIIDKYDIEEIKEKLERCRNIPIEDINSDNADDLADIKISRRKSRKEKIFDFIIVTKNLYAFKVDGTLVKISFSNNNRKAEDCINRVIKNRKEMEI